MEEFQSYLEGKKINATRFLQEEPERYNEYLKIFNQVHPNSFTAQKLFVVNDLRRKYPGTETTEPKKQVKPKLKPVIRKKI